MEAMRARIFHRSASDAQQSNSNKNFVASRNASEDRRRSRRDFPTCVIRLKSRRSALASRVEREAQRQIETIGLPLVLSEHSA